MLANFNPQKQAVHLVFILFFFICLSGTFSVAEEPLKIYYVTGGGWHDYETQKEIISNGLEERTNVSVTVNYLEGGKQAPEKHPAYKGDNWAEGYDLVIHNICNASDTNDPEWVNHIVKPHRNGKPAVFIHCSMHCFTPDRSREWQKLIGVTSSNHESKHPITVSNEKPEHPIMKKFPDSWTTPKGEFYRIKKRWPNAVPLATGVSGEKRNTFVSGPTNTVTETCLARPSDITMKPYELIPFLI